MIQSMWCFQRFNRRNMILFNVPTQTSPTSSTSKAIGPVSRQNSRISFASSSFFTTIPALVPKPKKDRKVSCCIRTPCDLFWIIQSIRTIEGDDGYCLGLKSGGCRSTVLKSRILAGKAQASLPRISEWIPWRPQRIHSHYRPELDIYATQTTHEIPIRPNN
jgi:hypothetical protein